jgi:hypothetical protein
MAMKIYEEFSWVKKVIGSCKTFDQLKSCTKLVDIFHNKYDPIGEITLANWSKTLNTHNTLVEMVNELNSEILKKPKSWE